MKPSCGQPGAGAVGSIVPWPCPRLRSWGDGHGGAWWLPGEISRSFPDGACWKRGWLSRGHGVLARLPFFSYLSHHYKWCA